MRIIRRALCALALGSAPAAYADFSWELAGLLGRSERDEGLESGVPNFESDVASVSGTYYLDAVADGNGPPALAAFLDPTTNVFVVAGEEDEAEDIGFNTVLERETTEYTVGGTYVFPQSKWYAGGRYSSPEVDEPPQLGVFEDSDQSRYGLVAGKYFGMGATRLELSLERSKLETEQSSGGCTGNFCGGFATSVQAETTVDDQRLAVMHVRRFRSATYALFGAVARTDSLLTATFTLTPPGQPPLPTETVELDLESDAYDVGAELYPIPTVGVRLSYARVDGPMIAEEDTVNVGASWFLRRNVGVELTLSSVDTEFFPRTERAALRVIGRF
jgi:hypothetical protein